MSALIFLAATLSSSSSILKTLKFVEIRLTLYISYLCIMVTKTTCQNQWRKSWCRLMVSEGYRSPSLGGLGRATQCAGESTAWWQACSYTSAEHRVGIMNPRLGCKVLKPMPREWLPPDTSHLKVPQSLQTVPRAKEPKSYAGHLGFKSHLLAVGFWVFNFSV